MNDYDFTLEVLHVYREDRVWYRLRGEGQDWVLYDKGEDGIWPSEYNHEGEGTIEVTCGDPVDFDYEEPDHIRRYRQACKIIEVMTHSVSRGFFDPKTVALLIETYRTKGPEAARTLGKTMVRLLQ